MPAVDAGEIAIYAEPLLATRVAQNFGIKLLEPPYDFLFSLPESWRKRSILLTTMKEARLTTEPGFIKSAAGKEFDARVYASGRDLPRGELVSDSLPVLIQEIVTWDVEYRCFVSDRVVRTASSYWRYGKDPRDKNGVWCTDEVREATEFCNALLADPAVTIPEACIIDGGLIQRKGWAVIESNAAWSSGIYGCDGTAVLPALLRACPPNK